MWAKVSLNLNYLNCAVSQSVFNVFPFAVLFIFVRLLQSWTIGSISPVFLMKGIRQSSTVSVSYIKTRYSQWNVLGSSFSNEGPRLSERGMITKSLWKNTLVTPKETKQRKVTQLFLIAIRRSSTKIFKFGQKTMWYEKKPKLYMNIKVFAIIY